MGELIDPGRPYVPRLAVRWLAERPTARHRRVDGSLLFPDVSGFTRLSERLAVARPRRAEEVVGLVERRAHGADRRDRARGGDVFVFAGDALVVLFDGDDPARRAVSTAIAIRRWFETRGSIPTSVGRVTLRVSIGVASGPVDLCLPATPLPGPLRRRADDDPMVRLERAAEAGEVLWTTRPPPCSIPTLAPRGTGRRQAARGGPARRRGRAGRPAAGAAPAWTVSLVPAPLRPFLARGAAALESEHRLATIAFVLAGDLDARLETEPDASTSRPISTRCFAAAARPPTVTG